MRDLPEFALSIRQPWAWAIVYCGKDVENRDWPTNRRGPICIHASKGMTVDEYDECMDFIACIRPVDPQESFRRRARFQNADGGERHRGHIIGVADIIDCVEQSRSDWFFGRYGFVLANVRPVRPIPVRGSLGFFRWKRRIVGGTSV